MPASSIAADELVDVELRRIGDAVEHGRRYVAGSTSASISDALMKRPEELTPVTPAAEERLEVGAADPELALGGALAHQLLGRDRCARRP